MLGVLYILFSFLTGYVLCTSFLPQLDRLENSKLLGHEVKLNPLFYKVPAWYATGSLCMTWTTYFGAYGAAAFFDTRTPLLFGNMFSFVFFLIFDVILLMRLRNDEKLTFEESWKKFSVGEIIFLIVSFVLTTVFMFGCFFVKDGAIRISYNVYSDFSPHLAMIRSFSFGNNFPTQYAHFAGTDVKYHFLFQFMVGNLEYLGMRIDWAFNVPSIISLFNTCLLTYTLGCVIIGKKVGGYLSTLFFAFRSSPSFLRFIAEVPKGESVWEAIKNQSVFICYTGHEDWGLWNLNVYCNQRHLAFSLDVMLLAVLLFLPYVDGMFEMLKEQSEGILVGIKRLIVSEFAEKAIAESEAGEEAVEETVAVAAEREAETEVETEVETEAFAEANEEIENESAEECIEASLENETEQKEPGQEEPEQEEPEQLESEKLEPAEGRRSFLNVFLLSKEAWMPASVVFAIFMGIFLGAIAFWNGAVLIGTLAVLFVMALVSKNRLDYLITAVISVACAFSQSKLFINGSAVSTEYFFGFLAENKTLFGSIEYLWELWGLLLVLAVLYLFLKKGAKRYLALAFSAPLIAAFTLKMTVDVATNHKFVMMSAMLLSVMAAEIVTELLSDKETGKKVLAWVLIVLMTCTGIFDGYVVLKKNKEPARYMMDDPLTVWVRDNASSEDIFMIGNEALSPIMLGGGMVYNGWPYYAWSAGYDTAYRDQQMKAVYEADSPEVLRELAKQNGIDYIVVNGTVRGSDYVLREDVIGQTFPVVFTMNEGVDRCTIYSTKTEQ